MFTEPVPATVEPIRAAASSGFWLRKWYLDAADERGNVYIGYWAAVRWKKLSLHYYEHMWRTPEAGMASRSAFKLTTAPAWQSGTRLSWKTTEASAEWISSCGAAINERLLETPHGCIDWHCCLPKARASIELPGLAFSGWGYAECLVMSVPAWELPLSRLYWGRAHSQDHYMVWIQGDGLTRSSLLWHDGQCDTRFDLSPRSVTAGAISLQVDNCWTLRKGPIRSTVFRPLGKLLAKVPARALLVDEHKLAGTGVIVADGESQPATAIYEEVRW